MKNILRVLAMGGLLSVGFSPAFADSFMDQLQAAVASGNMEKVELLAATHPDQQGDIGAYLLQQASTLGATDAGKSAKLLNEAKSYIGQMNATQSQQAATEISGLLTLASGSGFETDHPDAAGDILSAIVTMSGQTNIASVSPLLETTAINAAKSFESSAPANVKSKLEQVVSLAQAQNLAPHANVNNIHIPSSQ